MYLVISKVNVCGDDYIKEFDNLEEAQKYFEEYKNDVINDTEITVTNDKRVMRYATIYIAQILEKTETYPYKVNIDNYKFELVRKDENRPNEYLDKGCKTTHLKTGKTAISTGWGDFEKNKNDSISDIVSQLLKEGLAHLI